LTILLKKALMTGHGLLDLASYEAYLSGHLAD
jgi:predicted alternative tryptophan synthase beta-subunit